MILIKSIHGDKEPCRSRIDSTMLGSLVLALLLSYVHAQDEGSSSAVISGNLTRKSFPKGFVFGAGGSALQVEGAAHEDGKGPSVWDVFSHTPGKISDNSTTDVVADEYHRYKEDVELVKFLGLDAYRFSVAWSRILPKGRGKVNQQGIAYYNRLIDTLLQRGIEPFITLHHFDLPQALEDKYGGWLSPKIVNDYKNYVNICFNAFGDRVKKWVTLNEPHIYSTMAYNWGSIPPEHCSPEVGVKNCTIGNSSVEPYIVGHHLLLAHATATNLFKTHYKVKQGGQIGITLDSAWYEPLNSSNARDVYASNVALDFELGWFLHPIVYGDYPSIMRVRVGKRLPHFTTKQSIDLKTSVDFVGINHYSTGYATPSDSDSQSSRFINYFKDHRVHTTTLKNGVLIGELVNNLNIVPWGIGKLLNYIKTKYNNPIIWITENGISDPHNYNLTNGALNDETRIKYMRGYLSYVSTAIKTGSNVHGYFAWALLDNWEFTSGFLRRFGLYFVDHDDNLKRYAKASALWYKNMLQS